jgi:hypothetical protein
MINKIYWRFVAFIKYPSYFLGLTDRNYIIRRLGHKDFRLVRTFIYGGFTNISDFKLNPFYARWMYTRLGNYLVNKLLRHYYDYRRNALDLHLSSFNDR